MERDARLRAVANRKVRSVDGAYHISRDRKCLVFPEFEVIDAEGKKRKLLTAESDVVTFRSTTPVSVSDIIGFVRVNKELYSKGSIMNVLPLVSPSDGPTTVEFTFKPNARLDVSKLSHLFELYLGE